MEKWQKAVLSVSVLLFIISIIAMVLAILIYTHEQDIKTSSHHNSLFTYHPNAITSLKLTGGVTGTSDEKNIVSTTVVTNADLTGVVTSVGNETNIADDTITTAMLATPQVVNYMPTQQNFITPANGTYILPQIPRKPLYIKVVLAGGGGGGASSFATGSSAAVSGGNGSTTQFGINMLSVEGGKFAVDGVGGAGGTVIIQNIGVGMTYPGSSGGSANNTVFIATSPPGNNDPITSLGYVSGIGGSSFDGGGGTSCNTAGINGLNGAGGSGGGVSLTVPSGVPSNLKAGGGGGGGAWLDVMIENPLDTYDFSVGAGGPGGTSGFLVGGNGGDGVILVTEYYQ